VSLSSGADELDRGDVVLVLSGEQMQLVDDGRIEVVFFDRNCRGSIESGPFARVVVVDAVLYCPVSSWEPFGCRGILLERALAPVRSLKVSGPDELGLGTPIDVFTGRPALAGGGGTPIGLRYGPTVWRTARA